ncbi:polysaccharide deacetylase family protein [Kordiimonas sp. SCSIO 12610]|uniref:polysaccharide deacetylase family protein n=1 Tax=Kordiimonas sp. SCSIO 12610 TaxID=2829597 RepID=UPI00210A65AF|nr:polysaccharide deacetylase family protein [Kordiimonas sp. SCSIO 12610]UTW55869.1 polysaccharide deacetylase family protein [Kordiimonas sp. SCSIO 12610]
MFINDQVISVIFIFAGICLFIFLWFLAPYIWRLYEVKKLRKLCSDAGAVVLTFDDGPHHELSKNIMQLLDKNSIKGSFFFLGSNAVNFPDVVDTIKKRGHDIGHHSYAHFNAWKSLPHTHIKDIYRGEQEVTKLGGNKTLFRPTYGKISLASWLFGLLRGYQFCWWTIDPKDSLENPRPYADILAEIKVNNGGVILLHDNDTYPDENHSDYVLGLIQGIIELAEKDDLKILSFSQLNAINFSSVN